MLLLSQLNHLQKRRQTRMDGFLLYFLIFIGVFAAIMGLVVVIMKLLARRNPRFSQKVSFLGDVSTMTTQIDTFLKEQGYFPTKYKSETGVYQKGTGWWVAKRFIKMAVAEEGFLVEAFISAYGTATGLKGVLGVLPKKMCKKDVDELIQYIQSNNHICTPKTSSTGIPYDN